MTQNCESGNINYNEVDTILYIEEPLTNENSENSGNDEKGGEIYSPRKINRKVCFHSYKAKMYHVSGCISPKYSSDVLSSERETSASSPELELSDVDCRMTSYVNKPQTHKDFSYESNSDTDLHYRGPNNWQPPNNDYLHRVASIVEYYMSDENLLKDMFLLKHILKYQGFISLKLISKYKRVKRICKDWRNVKIAIKTSDKLELNEEETKVRRREPLPPDLESRNQFYRSILAYDIPSDKVSIVKVAEIFGIFGEINSIHLYKPGGKKPPNFHKVAQTYPQITSCVCAIIEFEKNLSAHEAIKSLRSDIHTPIKAVELFNLELWSNKQRYLRKGLENESSYYSASDIESEESTTSPCYCKYHFGEFPRSSSSFYNSPAKDYQTQKSETSYSFTQGSSHSTKYHNYPDSHPTHRSQIYSKFRGEQNGNHSPDLSRMNNNRKAFATSMTTSPIHNICLKNCFEKAKSRILHNESSSCPNTPVTSPLPFRKTNSQKPLKNISRTPYGPDGTKGFHNRCNSK